MKKIRNAVELSVMCATLVLSLMLCSFVLNRQASSNELRVRNFYREQADSLDVVLVGSSLFYNGYSAPLAWKEGGYTSYVLATSGVPMGVIKSMVKEVRRTQDPKVILIDLNSVIYDEQMETREGMIRYWIDNMPDSENKEEVIRELIPEEEQITYRIPLLKYHDNWKQLLPCLKLSMLELRAQWSGENLVTMGMQTSTKHPKQRKLKSVHGYTKQKELHSLSGRRFQELLDYLKEENVDHAVFVAMPKFYDDKHLQDRELLNRAMDMARKAGFRVYDFDVQTETIGLDPYHDYFDYDHLNLFGQQKMTRFLIKRLKQDFDLKREYDHAAKIRWEKEYDSYTKLFSWFQQRWLAEETMNANYKNIDEIIDTGGDR